MTPKEIADTPMPRTGVDDFWEKAATHMLREDAEHMGIKWADYCKRYGLLRRDRVRYEASVDPAVLTMLSDTGIGWQVP